VGIGFNVNQSVQVFAAPGLEHATSLAIAAAKRFDGQEMARLLIHQLDDEYTRLCSGDLATLEACWKWRLGLLGQQVQAECADGTHHGRLLDVGWDGLELEAETKERIRLKPEKVQHLF